MRRSPWFPEIRRDGMPARSLYLQAPLAGLFHAAFCAGVMEAHICPLEISMGYVFRQGGVVTDSRPQGVTTTEQSFPPHLRQLAVAAEIAPERSNSDAAAAQAPSMVLSANERQLLPPVIAILQSFWAPLAQLNRAERLAAS